MSFHFLLREAWLIDFHGKTPLEYALEQELYEFVDPITEHAMLPFNVASPATLSVAVKILYEKIRECVRTFYQQRIDSQRRRDVNDENCVARNTDLLDLYQLDFVTDAEAQADILVLDDLLESMLDLLLEDDTSPSDSNNSVVQAQAQRINIYEIDTDEKLIEFWLKAGDFAVFAWLDRPPLLGFHAVTHLCVTRAWSLP